MSVLLPLARRARQQLKAAGLAGPDPVSELNRTMQAEIEAMDALGRTLQALMLNGPRLRLTLALVALVVLLGVLAGVFAGYRWGRASLAQECAQRAFATTTGVACVLWPAPPGAGK